MLTGGRILHHLKRLLPDPRNTVALVGYQAAGTPGRLLQDHAPSIRIHKEDVTVRATIADLCGFSGHADPSEIQRWLSALPKPPKTIFLTHGEPDAATALAATLQQKGFAVKVPKLGEVAEL
jgi:metallo-beta-lactamase family protein